MKQAPGHAAFTLVGALRGVQVESNASLTRGSSRGWIYSSIMKSAYEIAMEKLAQSAPPAKLTAGQKKRLAELDSQYAAKVAEREIFLRGQIEQSVAKGEFEAVEQLEKQLVSDRKSLQTEREEKKDKIRKAKGP